MAGGASDGDDEISGINVTPLVDITLVLLIIFMVTANMIANHGMKMDLPKAAKSDQIQMVFAVNLGADGKTTVDRKPVQDDAAIPKLAVDAKKKNPDVRAVIAADKAVKHGRVMHVLDLLRGAGIQKIAFAVSPASKQAAADDAKAPKKN